MVATRQLLSRASRHEARDVLRVGYRSILIPVNVEEEALPWDMFDSAARLAAQHRAVIELLAFTEIPLSEEMDVELPGAGAHVERMAKDAALIGARYALHIRVAAPRTRDPAETILAEARRRHADLIMLGATGRRRNRAGFALDQVTRRVIAESPVRVMLVQPSEEDA
jgi:nucleotide-binding universal stress UspA family protein